MRLVAIEQAFCDQTPVMTSATLTSKTTTVIQVLTGQGLRDLSLLRLLFQPLRVLFPRLRSLLDLAMVLFRPLWSLPGLAMVHLLFMSITPVMTLALDPSKLCWMKLDGKDDDLPALEPYVEEGDTLPTMRAESAEMAALPDSRTELGETVPDSRTELGETVPDSRTELGESARQQDRVR